MTSGIVDVNVPTPSPSVLGVSISTGIATGLQSLALNNGLRDKISLFGISGVNLPRVYVDTAYGFISTIGAAFATPYALPYVPAVTSEDGTTSSPNNLYQCLIPPTIGGALYATILASQNDENGNTQILKNIFVGATSQIAGYFIADAVTNGLVNFG